MNPTEDIDGIIRRLHVPASAELDERVHRAILEAAPPWPPVAALEEVSFWTLVRMLMKKKSTRYTIVTTLGLALLAALTLNHSTTSAWAIEESIEALKKSTPRIGARVAQPSSAATGVWTVLSPGGLPLAGPPTQRQSRAMP